VIAAELHWMVAMQASLRVAAKEREERKEGRDEGREAE